MVGADGACAARTPVKLGGENTNDDKALRARSEIEPPLRSMVEEIAIPSVSNSPVLVPTV